VIEDSKNNKKINRRNEKRKENNQPQKARIEDSHQKDKGIIRTGEDIRELSKLK
jgi:hypothetical protein